MFKHWISAAVMLALSGVGQAAELYVATNGNDSWSGTLATSNGAGTDGPLATLEAARNRARVLAVSQPVTVLVRGGTYVLDRPFVLAPEDSGSEQQKIVYAAYPGERPQLSGGRQIVGWQRGPGELWQVELPQVRAGEWYFRQLFVGGERRQRARTPNQGYHRIAKLIPGPPHPQGKPVARDQFGFAPGDIQPWKQLSDVNIVLMHSWETSLHPIKSVDMDAHVVHFTAPLKEWWGIGYWEDAQRYYVENAFELLDEPGEWYLDRETGVLSYWPRPGEELDQTEVIAPVLSELVRMEGDADAGKLVEHVTLRGFSLQYADWELAPGGNSSTQAAVEVPAVVTANGASHCAIEDCEVAHIGTYGIWLRRGCKDCRIQRNLLHDLGAGGIRVGEANMARTDAAETSRSVVDNNHIYDGGHVYAAGIGIWLAQSSHNQISHNDIHDLNYSGISIGWNWGLQENRTHHNMVELNHVHDLGHGVLSDAGLIYCLGVSPGSVIRNNVFHDMWPYSEPAFGWGIYLDAQCGNYLVENNLVYNTQSGGLMFNNGGHEHVIRNNIFALSATYGLWPYSEKRPSTFRRNIVYLTQGQLLVPYGERSFKQRIAAHEPLGDWDANLYWHTTGPDALRFYQFTFDKWQALGLDRTSLVADPKFVDPAQHDFRLSDDSPARSLGFQPFDISEAGLYGDPAWANQVRHAACPCRALPAPPPPPAPLSVRDTFEQQPVGRHPARAQVSGEEKGASICISDERAATGRQSLAVNDSATLQPSWQPHFYYQPEINSGTVKQSFDVWISQDAQFFTEWRDMAEYPANVGPSVRFDGTEGVSVAGRKLAEVSCQQWLHVEIEASLGNGPRTFRLSLAGPDGKVTAWDDLPIAGAEFRELKWLGFSSTSAADTVFYIDNLSFGLAQPRMHWADTVSGQPFSKDPAVIKFQGKYWLYYSLPPYANKAGQGWTIGVAESHNLVDWNKIGELTSSGPVEEKGFTAPGAIVLGNRVHLFYQTYGNGSRDAICHAWSDDGLHFQRDPTNPIFRPTGTWNCGRAIDADIIEHDGKLLLYWATRDPEMKVQMQGVAAAPLDSDLARDKWTQLNPDGPILQPGLPTPLDDRNLDLSWEGRCIEAAAMARHDGKLYMFYAGNYNNAPQQIGVAVSEDGVHFRRLSDKPLVPNGPPGSWNERESGHPFLFQDDDGRDYLFYQGNQREGTWFLSVVPIDWKDGLPVAGCDQRPMTNDQ